MRYFTKQYWRDMQKDAVNPTDAFERDMGQRWKRYQKQLKDVLPYLPKTTRSYVENESFNGAYVADIKIVQRSVLKMSTMSPRLWRRKQNGHKIDIHVTLIFNESNMPRIRCELTYKNVKSYKIDYPTSDPITFATEHGLDAWAYNELSRSGEWLTHDVLHESGAEMTITFKSLSLKRSRY